MMGTTAGTPSKRSVREANRLLRMSEEELTAQLTARVQAIAQDTRRSQQSSYRLAMEVNTLEGLAVPGWVKKTVEAIVRTALRQMHNVVCSDEADFAGLRQRLQGALDLGSSAAVLALAALLTSTLGLAAALAPVVATIVIKKIGEPALRAGHETICEELSRSLPN